MKVRNARRLIATAAVASLGLLSAKSAQGALLAGPLLDSKGGGSGGPAGIIISIHSEFWSFTDDYTITIGNTTAYVAGVGYAETDPNNSSDYLVTTIYGDDLNHSSSTLQVGEVAGVSTTSPDFAVLGGENILGNNGIDYKSSVNESLPYSELSSVFPDDTSANPNTVDLSPFSSGPGNFSVFQTEVPISAVPEPASFAILLGGAGLISLRRRRRVSMIRPE